MKQEEHCYGDARSIWKHVLPNIMGPVIVICASNFAAAILIEAGLSFLGIGVQLPTPSWGFMIEQHKGLIMDPDKAYMALRWYFYNNVSICIYDSR